MSPNRWGVALAFVCAAGCGLRGPEESRRERSYRGWPAYGGGPESLRYSALDQINRDNVGRLQVAWTYDSGEEGGLQTNPIVVDGVLYTTTPKHRVVALDAASGALRWRFDSKIEASGPNRGVTYWASGDDRRIFTAQDHFVYALDAGTGQPLTGFGRDGRIDLHEDLGRPAEEQSVRLTTPGIVYKDLLIVGGRVGEALPASPGHVRAYDAKTGKLRWTFHTIPQPGEPGHETWPKDAWTVTGGANNWAGMAVDERRGIVYVPTGSAAADFYGANRAGDNLYANSLLALDADDGQEGLALPGDPPRPLGPGLPRSPEPRDRHARRAAGSTPSPRRASRDTSTCSTARAARRFSRSRSSKPRPATSRARWPRIPRPCRRSLLRSPVNT